MKTTDLKQLANRSRSMREAGFALIMGCGVLGLFLFIPQVFSAVPQKHAAVATSTAPDAFANVPIQAHAAIVYDLATHKVLYAKNAYAQLPLASLTKLLTMYAAFSTLSPSTPITIPQDVTGLSEPHAFTPGQVLTLGNLARLTLTGSLNDGAAAIAEATAERESTTTSALLGSVASALGLSQTYALNGNGLDINTAISGGYGSAYDVAQLAGAFEHMEPTVAAATTHPYATARSEGGTAFKIKNTDPMTGTIPGLLLSKTGYTTLAGGNLVLVFNAAFDHPIAVVVLGSNLKARFTDSQALVAATFAHFAGVKSL